ncbi:MAG: hypothetical protein KDD94_12615, partial [Calditrichaeota bacterium]|nr:hypothetical protein [Calditrichota bacterium]
MARRLIFLFLILIACDSSTETEENFANSNWTFNSAPNLGINQAKLDSGMQLVSSGYLPNINAVLLVKDGQ